MMMIVDTKPVGFEAGRYIALQQWATPWANCIAITLHYVDQRSGCYTIRSLGNVRTIGM